MPQLQPMLTSSSLLTIDPIDSLEEAGWLRAAEVARNFDRVQIGTFSRRSHTSLLEALTDPRITVVVTDGSGILYLGIKYGKTFFETECGHPLWAMKDGPDVSFCRPCTEDRALPLLRDVP